MTYIWESPYNPAKIKLRKDYNLDSVAQDGKTEFEKQLLLKSWVHTILPDGKPERDYYNLSALDILEDAKKGKTFWCTQYAQVFIQAGIALDFYTRKLGVDTKDPEKDMHHGIADIWSNDFQKWYAVDPQSNLHYEKDGIPLNALEIRNEYLSNKGAGIKGIIGNYEKIIQYDTSSEGYDSPSNYFWFYIALRNNFFEKPNIYDSVALLYIDEHNKDLIWYRGGGIEENLYPHPMYASQFITTSNIDECFPNMIS